MRGKSGASKLSPGKWAVDEPRCWTPTARNIHLSNIVTSQWTEQWHHLVQADLVSVGEQKIQILERLAQEEGLHHVLGPGVQGVPHVADGGVAAAHLAVLLNALQWQLLAHELDKSEGHKPEISSTPSPGRSCCPRSSRGTTSSPPSRVWGGSVRRWAANTIVDCGDCVGILVTEGWKPHS